MCGKDEESKTHKEATQDKAGIDYADRSVESKPTLV